MIITFTEAMEYIYSTGKYGSVLGLESMKCLLEELNNPQKELKFVHIGGTNGKGSTGAFIGSVLAVSGYKVGRYISPSVLAYEEKIQTLSYDGKGLLTSNITKDQTVEAIKEIKSACDRMVEKGHKHPTTFEIETAMSFLHFKIIKCDITVIEVGLGGRLDATNVIQNVLCSVITSISMDHMDYLGDTLAKIAKEKAGIIKPFVPVVSYEQQKEVRKVLKETCDSQNSSFVMADFSDVRIIAEDLSGTIFHYQNYKDLFISLLGENQVYNGVVALHAIEELIKKGYTINEKQIREGFRLTKWRGRFEVIKEHPTIIVDGAHNEDAARMLAHNIELYFNGKHLTFIMGVLKDKDYESILQHTASYANTIITITPNNNRGLPSSELAKAAREYCNHVIDGETVSNALELALEQVDKEDIVLIFGSLSFLGDIYKELAVGY